MTPGLRPITCPINGESKGIFLYYIGVIHKPRRQPRGRGVSQMSTFLYNPYIVKWSTKGEGVENVQKTVYVVYERHLKEMCQLLRK